MSRQKRKSKSKVNVVGIELRSFRHFTIIIYWGKIKKKYYNKILEKIKPK